LIKGACVQATKINLAKIHHQAARIIQGEHAVGHGLGQEQRQFDRAAAVFDHGIFNI
jgi:hypothetical protein